MRSEKYIDFHAHHAELDEETFVIQDGVQTRGRHPWYLETTHAPSLEGKSEKLLAIGESGLDRLCSTPYDLQLQVFRKEVQLSEQLRLPLFLHCVRAIDDVLRIRHELHALQPIIWHGYRGGACQLLQLIKPSSSLPTEAGRGLFFFSFGSNVIPPKGETASPEALPAKYREAVLACPLDRLLLETDEDLRPIATLYDRVARLRGISVEALIWQMHANFHTLFGQDMNI